MSILNTKEIIAVAVGGSVGSVARLILSSFVQYLIPFEELPWGIILVNILGCFLIGVLYGLFNLKLLVNPMWRAGLMIGVLGGFTTFSSFSLDTYYMLLKGSYFSAVSNIFLSITLCLLATALGAWSIAVVVSK